MEVQWIKYYYILMQIKYNGQMRILSAFVTKWKLINYSVLYQRTHEKNSTEIKCTKPVVHTMR